MKQLILTLLLIGAALAQDEVKDKKKGHMKPMGEQGDILNITEVEGFLSPIEFFDKYVYNEKPLVMRNAVEHWPAFEKWTNEYLEETLMSQGPAGDVLVNKAEKMSFPINKKYQNFKDFLKNNDENSQWFVKDAIPEALKKDIIMPFSLQCNRYFKDKLWGATFTMTRGEVRGPIRSNTFDPIYCVLRGSQKYVLVDYMPYWGLSPTLFDQVKAETEPEKVSTFQDPDVIDLDKTPYWAGVNSHHAEIRAGDCIQVTYDWVHRVITAKDSIVVSFTMKDRSKLVSQKQCKERESDRWTADKNFFIEHEDVEEKDIKNLLQTFLDNGATTKEGLAKFLLPDDVKATLTEEQVKSLTQRHLLLFSFSDFHQDGILSDLDFKARGENQFKRHFRRQARHNLAKVVDDYNLIVHKMRQANEKVQVKYLYRTRGEPFTTDNSIGHPKKREFPRHYREEL